MCALYKSGTEIPSDYSGVWRVEDCRSRNGSFVDGCPVTGTSVDARAGSIVIRAPPRASREACFVLSLLLTAWALR